MFSNVCKVLQGTSAYSAFANITGRLLGSTHSIRADHVPRRRRRSRSASCNNNPKRRLIESNTSDSNSVSSERAKYSRQHDAGRSIERHYQRSHQQPSGSEERSQKDLHPVPPLRNWDTSANMEKREAGSRN